MSILRWSAAAALTFVSTPALAATCVGTCGTLGPDGVVTAPPAGGPTYQYVATTNGVTGAGQIAGIERGTNGSEFVSDAFTVTAGDTLTFFFNYVTSDGSEFADYGFAQLLNSAGASLGYLFTARTTPTGDTSPGFGLPNNIATLTPGTTPIIPDATTFSPLGLDSGECFGPGCGNAGWIRSAYNITTGGSYSVRFGVTNTNDVEFQSALAFAGLAVNDVPIGGAVPEPATWAMMIVGFGAVGASVRRHRSATLGYV